MREALRQDREELVSVTGLNLEHARALPPDQATCSEEDAQIVVWSARQDRVIKKHEKERKTGVICCENVTRFPEKLLDLGYCGLGTAVKLSANLPDDKNLELLRGLPWPCKSFQERLVSFPNTKKQSGINCTAISATNLTAFMSY